MEIILNVVYGGNNLAETTTAPIVREVRRMLKKSFYYFDNEAVKQIKLFLFFISFLFMYSRNLFVLDFVRRFLPLISLKLFYPIGHIL